MNAYFDSSAFVKLFLDEPGSIEAAAVWDDAVVCVSSMALLAETRAALASATRSRRVTATQHRQAVDAFDDRWSQMAGFELTEPLARRAGELAEVYALRGYDAIHLASAEAILDEGDVMIVSDTRLAEAAASLGIDALVPAEA